MNEKNTLPTDLWRQLTKDWSLSEIAQLRLVSKHFCNQLTRLLQIRLTESVTPIAVYNSERDGNIQDVNTLFQCHDGGVIGVASDACAIGLTSTQSNIPSRLPIAPVTFLMTKSKEIYAYGRNGDNYRLQGRDMGGAIILDQKLELDYNLFKPIENDKRYKRLFRCGHHEIRLNTGGVLSVKNSQNVGKVLVKDINEILVCVSPDYDTTFNFLLLDNNGSCVYLTYRSDLRTVELTENINVIQDYCNWVKKGLFLYHNGMLSRDNEFYNLTLDNNHPGVQMRCSKIDLIKTITCSLQKFNQFSSAKEIEQNWVEYYVLGRNGALYFAKSPCRGRAEKYKIDIEAIDSIIYVHAARFLIALSKKGNLYQVIQGDVKKIGTNIQTLITDSGWARSNAYCLVVDRENRLRMLTEYLGTETCEKLEITEFYSDSIWRRGVSSSSIQRFNIFNEHRTQVLAYAKQLKTFDVDAFEGERPQSTCASLCRTEKDFEAVYLNLSNKLVCQMATVDDLPAIREDFSYLFYQAQPEARELQHSHFDIFWLTIGRQLVESYKNNSPLDIEAVTYDLSMLMNNPNEGEALGMLGAFISPLIRLEREAAEQAGLSGGRSLPGLQ